MAYEKGETDFEAQEGAGKIGEIKLRRGIKEGGRKGDEKSKGVQGMEK